jgi:PHD/YefM family antitoxin component YafN of YafNO toxin-antitoxin module
MASISKARQKRLRPSVEKRTICNMKTQPMKTPRFRTKNVKTSVAAPGDRYLELVRENPLRVLHGEEEYQSAIAMLDRLSDRGNGRTSDETE